MKIVMVVIAGLVLAGAVLATRDEPSQNTSASDECRPALVEYFETRDMSIANGGNNIVGTGIALDNVDVCFRATSVPTQCVEDYNRRGFPPVGCLAEALGISS